MEINNQRGFGAMKSRSDLEKLKSTIGLNIWQIERDYLQHLFLLFLSRRESGNFIFKGGTALQKLYGLNRFSIDLDFTLKGTNPKLLEILESINKDFDNFNFNSNIKITEKKESITAQIKIKGPLYENTDNSISSLKIEISKRENVLVTPEKKEIIPIYDDISPYFILVMSLEEILAEKVRALLKRSKARDLYDLWFLVKRGVNINREILEKKLDYYEMSFKKENFIETVKNTSKLWEKELKPLVKELPDFETVKNVVVKRFESL